MKKLFVVLAAMVMTLSASAFDFDGITRVVYQEGYPDEFSLEIFSEAGVRLEQFKPEA